MGNTGVLEIGGMVAERAGLHRAAACARDRIPTVGGRERKGGKPGACQMTCGTVVLRDREIRRKPAWIVRRGHCRSPRWRVVSMRLHGVAWPKEQRQACDACMRNLRHENDFSHRPWVATAVHQFTDNASKRVRPTGGCRP